MKLKGWTILAACSLSTLYAGCSSKSDEGKTIGPEDIQNTGGTSGSGASGAGAAGGLIFPGGSGSTNGGGGLPMNVGGTCGGQVIQAEALPIDMYIMFDQSDSMNKPVPPPGTGTWWNAAQQAVVAFANNGDAANARIGVGLQFFPLGGVAPKSCDQAQYTTPEVEIAPLPGNAGAVTTVVNAHQPTTFTPTAPALSGAIAHMKAWGPAHPGHAPVVVFVTDGFPTECDPRDIVDIADIAKQAYETDPPVRTFVVGFNLGPGKENLNAIAKAGGTETAFFIDGGDIGGQFVAAMLNISDAPLQCSFDIPKPEDGTKVDINMVSVTYTPNSTKLPEEVPKLNTLGDCSLNSGNGWYYDNPQTPTKIEICPGTCKKFGAGTVQTKIGCKPVTGTTM